MEIHLNEMGVTELRKAAMATDSSELTHKEAPLKGKFGRQDWRQVVTDRPATTTMIKSPPTYVQFQAPGKRFETPYFRHNYVIATVVKSLAT